MTNSSATGGYLAPNAPPAPAPLEGKALLEFLQPIWVGITGLPGALFFPWWQLEPPNLPPAGTDWASFQIVSRKNKKFAYITHVGGVGQLPGYDVFQTHEELDILTSFYGPNADQYAALLRDGIYIPHNRDPLQLAGMALIDTGDLVTAPSLVKERWLYRVDLSVRIRRLIVRYYPVLDLASAGVTVNNEEYTTVIPVTNPEI